MPYYQSSIKILEDIRASIKHADPEQLDLYHIRDSLGPVILDLQVLESLRRPESYKLQQTEDGFVRITIEMVVDQNQAEDMLKGLWLQSDT